MDPLDLSNCQKEFKDLSEEYMSLESLHKQYVEKLDELSELQAKCVKGLGHQRYRLGIIKRSLDKKSKGKTCGEEQQNLDKDMMRREAQLNEMEQALPKPNGLYLKVILGNVNVSIVHREEKFKYKDEYEKFKLILSGIGTLMSLVTLLTNYRVLDLMYMFLLVWYYCTLTIRESILKVNGSRIKGWWRTHHFISTVLAAVILIWPQGKAYYAFRLQFMIFNVYINFVQCLQFRYQRGCLYRLKALGQRHNMDITIEGFHSWMWFGLSFLLPFLYFGYLFELYNAWKLYQLALDPESPWQVPVASVLFLVLFLGNTITTSLVIPQKLQEKVRLKYRFTRLDKYFWSHNKDKRSLSIDQEKEKEAQQLPVQNHENGGENLDDGFEDLEPEKDEIESKKEL